MTTRPKNGGIQHQRSEIHVQQSFSGPLPPPETLAKYNDVLPNAAERILAMAESQHQHRQALEYKVVAANVGAQKMGVALGFIVGMTAIGGGIYLAATGKPVSGLTAIISSLTALVGTFVYGRQTQKKDLRDKDPR